MFVLEFESSSPASAAAYYSLVVRREPYTIGRLPNCDVALPELSDVSRQHVKLEVLRASDALKLDATRDPTAIGGVRGDGGVGSPPRRVDRQIAFHASSPQEPPPELEDNGCSHDGVGGGHGVVFGCLEYCLMRVPEALSFLEDDPLVLRLTNLSRFGTRVEAPQHHEDAAGHGAAPPATSSSSAEATTAVVVQSSIFVHNGWRICVGGQCTLRVTFRPVVVSVARDYVVAYIDELEAMYRLLGATCMKEIGPVSYGAVPTAAAAGSPEHEANKKRAALQSLPNSRRGSATMPSSSTDAGLSSTVARRRCQPLAPLLAAHVCETIADDSWSLMALAAGYSMVTPTYVFEFYASLATSCRAPLHELPAPAHFSPQTKLATYHTTPYLRPESETCPFSLYPIVAARGPPTSGSQNVSRSREGLMSHKLFFAPSEVTYLRNKGPVELCGGVVLHSLREVVAAARNGGSGGTGLNPLALHARYIVLEDAIVDAVRRTSVADLKAYSALRKNKSLQAASPLATSSFDDASIIDNTSLFSLPTDARPDDDDDVDEAEATLRLLVKLYLLAKHQSWLLITERCVHVALLSNQFTFQAVSFAEASQGGDGGVQRWGDPPAEETDGRRDPRLEHHDAAVYGSILSRKMEGSPILPANGGASQAKQLSPGRSPRSQRFNNNGANRGASEGAAGRGARDDDGEGGNDSDRTPSILSADEGDNPTSVGAPWNADVGFASPARTALGNHDVADATMMTSPLPVPPLSSAADPRHPIGQHQMLRQSPRRGIPGHGEGVARAMTLTAFEAQAELLRRTIQKILNPMDRQRLQGVAAATRSQRALDPVDRAFVQHLLAAARMQLQALEALHVQGREASLVPSHAAPSSGDGSGVGSTTRSRALMGLWNQCAGVVTLAEEVLSFQTATVAKLRGHHGANSNEGAGDDDPTANQNGLAIQVPERSGHYDPESSGAIGLCRRNAQQHGTALGHQSGLRPTTRMLRYPAPVASFLGPDVHRGGRVQLSEEHQLTARLLAPIQASNLAGVAEKRRLFVKRYHQEEGEKRFALWMQGNGAQWSIQLYRTLDERNMTLLEMLQYE